ncbi:hypothetical protein PVAP13_9KG215885 [Panicum virgatum]|uniref:Uncharacterized protein n=1 Tax=Panicum virgatum TaxID=38727 RepID=A0A8T0NHH1_PANVG|nr:hypothetical protein PVAP13_9KG215885 [Panicum virgatum]
MTAVGCRGSRVRALPQATAVSSFATGSRRGATAKEVLPCGGCRRSRPSISCSGTGCTIRRESGAPAAARGELDVVTLEEGSVLSKTRELRCGRLRVEVEAAAGRGTVTRAARRRLMAPGVGAGEGVLRGPVIAVAVEAIPVHCGAWRQGVLDRRWRWSGDAWPGKTRREPVGEGPRRGVARREAAPGSCLEGGRAGERKDATPGRSLEGGRAAEQGPARARRGAAPGRASAGRRASGGAGSAARRPGRQGVERKGVRWLGRGTGRHSQIRIGKKTWAPQL